MKTPEELAEEYSKAAEPVHVLTVHPVPQFRQAFLAGYQAAAPQWVSVKDRLPEKDTWVLSLEADKSMRVNCLASDDEWYCDDHGFVPTVTHWMPLPQPPKEEG